MAYISDNPQFRSLTDDEEEEFKQSARDNDPAPRPWGWDMYHPVCRAVWSERGLEETREEPYLLPTPPLAL